VEPRLLVIIDFDRKKFFCFKTIAFIDFSLTRFQRNIALCRIVYFFILANDTSCHSEEPRVADHLRERDTICWIPSEQTRDQILNLAGLARELYLLKLVLERDRSGDQFIEDDSEGPFRFDD
jgi:hypothetical protein